MSGINVVVGKSPKGVNVDVGNKSGDKNVIEEVQVNGSALPVDEHKAVNVPVPTALSQLTDDASHRLVTDTEKASWSAKSEFSGNYADLSGKPFIPTKVSDLPNDAGYLTQHQDLSGYYNKGEVDAALATKQATLVSGTNIKTINNESLLGGGNIEIEAGDEAVWGNISGTLSNQTDLASALSAKYEKPSGGIPSSDMTEAVQTSLGKADTALQSFTETDPTVPAWAKAVNPPTEVFWAVYGTTTAAEIDAAVAAGKAVMCNRNGHQYQLSTISDSYSVYIFAAVISTDITTLEVNKTTSAWSVSNISVQSTANRVNDIVGHESATNRYPSTKAVADYVASKAEVYWATRDVTTASEIATAISAGKIVACVYGQNTYILLVNNPSYYGFYALADAKNRILYCYTADSSWAFGEIDFERESRKKSSWSSTPSDTNYPSEKLVKDSLDAKQDTLTSGTNIKTINNESLLGSGNITINADTSDCVKTTQQSLTSAQQLQARANINTLSPNYQGTVTPVTTSAETVQNKAQTLTGNETDTTKYPSTKAVVDYIAGLGSDLRKLLLALGATYDTQTGLYTYGNLTDLTEADMINAYNASAGFMRGGDDMSYYMMYDESIRTVLFPKNSARSIYGARDFNLSGTFYYCINLEDIRPYGDNPNGVYRFGVSKLLRTFADCQKLKTIGPRFNVSKCTTAVSVQDAFKRCYLLESVYLYSLAASISFAESPNLTNASILYAIENVLSTASGITITLHPTAYNRAIADTDVQTALSNHTNVTLASA